MTDAKLADLPTRVVRVPQWARPFRVPRYIVRLQFRSARGWIKSAGWQVRYPRDAPWKYFADGNMPNRRGTPHASLARACEYLAKVYRGSASRVKRREKETKNVKLGVGIRPVMLTKRGRNVRHYYVEVSGFPSLRKLQRRFYVGTANTITRERYEAAIERARDYRAQLVRQHEEGRHHA
jgi:hypothetical protein